MFIKDGKRFNIYAGLTLDDVQYPAGFFTDPHARKALGIIEIPDPVRMPDETHYNQELDEAPYLVSTPKSPEVVFGYYRNKLEVEVQAYLDSVAQERGYDSIMSACTYATSSSPKFGPEGQACVEWRDAIWGACYGIMADVAAGKREVPTITDLVEELPIIAWPN